MFTKRKRSRDDEDGDPDPNPEPREVADRALTMLNSDARMTDAQPPTNGVSHHGPRTQQTPMYRYTDQNGLPTPDTPNSAGTDQSWATSNGPATNGYHHVNGGGTPTVTRPRKRVFSHRTRSGCMTCRNRKKKCDEGKPTCKHFPPFQAIMLTFQQVVIVSGLVRRAWAMSTQIQWPATTQ